MKLVVVFEVPDDRAAIYADVAARMVQRHAFAEQREIAHWSFDVQMRPVAAVMSDASLSDAARDARREVDQEHPWLPGAVFLADERLKPALLALLDTLI